MLRPLIIDRGALLAAAEIEATADLPVTFKSRPITRLRFWLGGKLFVFAAWVMGTNITLRCDVPRQNVRFRDRPRGEGQG